MQKIEHKNQNLKNPNNMALMKIKAKVYLMSESDMEATNLIEGLKGKSALWVWRQIALEAGDIYRIISYNSSKTLVMLHDGESLLVNETFDQVFDKWSENKPEDLDLTGDSDEETEINEEED